MALDPQILDPVKYYGNPAGTPTFDPTGKAIPVDTLGKSATPLDVPIQPLDTTNYTSSLNGVSSLASSVPSTTPITDKTNALTSRLEALYGQQGGLGAATQSANTTYGTEAKAQEVQNIANQIKALNAQAATAPLQVDQANQGKGIVQAIGARETAAAQRDLAIKSLSLGAQLSAAQGNLALAQQQAQQAIDYTYKPIQEQIDTTLKQIDAIRPQLTAEQAAIADARTAKLNEQKTELADKKKLATDVLNAAQANGDSVSAAAILRLDPNSSTFSSDLAKIQGTVIPDPAKQLDIAYKKAQIAKIYSDLNPGSSGVSTYNGVTLPKGIEPATAIAYAQQYASDGKIPSGLPKGTFGAISAIAKDLPKQDGEIVSNATGLKSDKLTATQADAYGSLRDLTLKISQAKELFDKIHTGITAPITGIAPSQERQEYNTLRSEIVDLLARARTGAAISASEEALYKSKIPSSWNQVLGFGTSGDVKLDGLKSSIEGKLENGLKANGASMYGFSKIKAPNGTTYVVGQVITADNGTKARVNADGSLTVTQ